MANKKKISLFFQSFIVIIVFLIMLFVSEYFLVRRILFFKENNTDTLELIKPDEVLLYQDNVKNMGLLFQSELKSLEQLNENVASTVQYNVKRRKIYKVKSYFRKFYAKHFYLDHLFFYNRFGRVLTIWPFSEKIHNNIYSFPRYYKYLKPKIIETKKTESYFYMFDKYVITNNMSSETISQAPFFSLSDIQDNDFKQVLSHNLLDVPEQQGQLQKMPFFIVATPIFYNKIYWGMCGFTVPMSYLLNKLKKMQSENLLAYFILSEDGYIFSAPNRGDIGKYAGHDELFENIQEKLKEYGNTGFLRYKNKIIFFTKMDNLIYIGVPFKFLNTISKNKTQLDIPPFLFLFFIFEFFLIFLLYILFYSKVIAGLKNFKIKNLEDINKLVEQKKEKNPLKNRIVSPLFVEAYKQHESDFSVPYFSVKAVGVFVSLHNVHEILENKDEGGIILNKFIETIYKLSAEFDGFVEHLSFNSFMIYFGAPFTDTQYKQKSANFLNHLLVEIKALNGKQNLKLKVGMAVDKGELFVSSFSFEGEEELVIAGDLLFLLQKYEIVATDNVAIIGEKYYEDNLLEQDKITETADIKIRNRKKMYKVFVYRGKINL